MIYIMGKVFISSQIIRDTKGKWPKEKDKEKVLSITQMEEFIKVHGMKIKSKDME